MVAAPVFPVVSARLALTVRDFDAYGVENVSSSEYTPARAELKQRTLAWAKPAGARLASLGLALDSTSSPEHSAFRGRRPADCQWVCFSRDAASRAEVERIIDEKRGFTVPAAATEARERHGVLALRLDADGVEVCFFVPGDARLDLDNLKARVVEVAAAAELVAAVEALPDEFTFGSDAAAATRCALVSPALLAGLADAALAGRGGVWIGWHVAKQTAVEHAELLDEQLEDALVALAPIYSLVAWAHDNDLAGLADTATRSTAWLRAPNPVGPSRSTGGSVEKGARVRVRSGPFADKVGTVSEVDGRGAARVMLGLLSSRFDLAELEPIAPGKDRPAFQSSHRRPMPQPPRKAR